MIDHVFGFNVHDIERFLYFQAKNLRPHAGLETLGAALHDGNQTWVGLDPDTLQTPYHELMRMLDLLPLRANQHVIDLGAGYGRMGIILNEIHPEVSFTGFEYVPERVIEGNRVYFDHQIKGLLLEADVKADHFILPQADYYFIYDFGKIPHIRKTLQQIDRIADSKKITVIARGRGVRSLIDFEFPWLSQVHSPIHEKNFSLYFS